MGNIDDTPSPAGGRGATLDTSSLNRPSIGHAIGRATTYFHPFRAVSAVHPREREWRAPWLGHPSGFTVAMESIPSRPGARTRGNPHRRGLRRFQTVLEGLLKEATEGVSAPLIIKYFRTKEGLLEELINFEAMKDLICEVPFGDIGTSLADDAINGDRSSTSSLVALLMATAGSPAAVKTVTDQFQESIGGALFDRIRDEAPGVTGDEDAEQRCQYALAMYTGLGTVLVSYARGILGGVRRSFIRAPHPAGPGTHRGSGLPETR